MSIEIRDNGGIFDVVKDDAVIGKDLSPMGLRKLAAGTEDKELARACRVALREELPKTAPEPKADGKKKADDGDDPDKDSDPDGDEKPKAPKAKGGAK